ncbi:MFS transporter [Burkholderia plantarii]|uniref:Permeases of the major facilitator superfamily n=1 Tax=Burkholderia plantarii TaxID=41899 RepID=A0A0B6RZC4_BURPL|nr:MFS transporter [Burkholderia plantarii]AJK47514.1 permeases of the major facilitator superfamily [Burkholderia plantarii]
MNLARSFRSLRNPNYRLWAAGALVSNVGTWVQRTAQSWLVLTQLTRHDASAVGIVMALQYAPQMLLLPWTGYAADHFDQRKLLRATQALMGVLAFGLGVIVVAGVARLWHVYLFALLFGSVAAFDAPVRQTFVTSLVGDADLANAVALNSTVFNAARMIGPGVAGLVISSIGTGWAFVANGLSFGAVLVSLSRLRVSEPHPGARSRRAQGGLAAGVRYVRGRPDLLAILAMLFLIGTFGLNFQIYIATMAVDVFHAGASGFGLLSSIMAIGTIAGALVAAGRDRPTLRTLLGGCVVFGIGCACAALAPGFWIFGAMLVVVGVAALTITNSSNSLMQLSTEPGMRGRVTALRVAIVMGGTPIGAPIVGWVADRFGPRWSLGVGAAAGVAAAVVALRAMRRQARDARAEARTSDESGGHGSDAAVEHEADGGASRPPPSH